MAANTLISTSRRLLLSNNPKVLNDFLCKAGDHHLQLSRCFSVTASANMRFVQFQLKNGGPQHIGAQLSLDGDIFDISAVDSSVPNSLLKFLSDGNGVVEKAKR